MCAEVGGSCTALPSTLCAPGFEPYSDNDPQHSDCFGQCCIEAPSSPCSDQENINCVPGSACSGDWEEVQGNVYCEEGRSCCFWAEL